MTVETLEQSQAPQESQWESVSNIDFAGDKLSNNTEDDFEEDIVQEDIAEIRRILDTRAIAESEDPEGLEEARKKDHEILVSCAQQRKELEDGVSEYGILSEEDADYNNSGRRVEVSKLIEKRKRSSIHKVLSFLHIPDKVLENISVEEARAKKRVERMVELASSGYSAEDGVERRREAIGRLEKTANNEEDYLRNFEIPLSREQKDKLLSYNVLAKISTEEYLKLWRHLNPQYVSHVTRQGYRDHSGMVYHTAGLGEFASGFTDVLKSGKALRSSMGLQAGVSKSYLLEDENTFRSYMENEFFKNGIPKSLVESEDLSPNAIAAVMGGAHGILSKPDGFWRDRTAVHVAANNVANSHYGAESDNEIFYVFPADVIMSQSGVDEGLFHKTSFGDRERMIRIGEQNRVMPYTGEIEHNDVSVFVEDGLPLDAGLVFLPKSTLVDPNTGSKYHDFDPETMIGTVMTEEMGGIPAKEYWEKYFKEHPEEKPAHIIYYDGDPEEAVAKMLAENGIYVGNRGDTTSETGTNLGFDDRIAYGGTELDEQLDEEAQKFFTKVADYIHSQRGF